MILLARSFHKTKYNASKMLLIMSATLLLTNNSTERQSQKNPLSRELFVVVKDHNYEIHPQLSVTIKFITSGFGNETYNITYMTE